MVGLLIGFVLFVAFNNTTLGINKPLSVEVKSRIAEGSGDVVPIPTLSCAKIVNTEMLNIHKVNIDLLIMIS